MNGELRHLLAEAGYGRALEPDAWSSAVVFRNFGAVPPVRGLPPDTFLRHFKLLLFDRKGRATHLARCGSPADASFERETRCLEVLSSAPQLAGTMPRTRSACSPSLRLQLTDYVPGRPYAMMVRFEEPAAWVRATGEILAESEAVGRCAEECLPELMQGGERIDIADAAGTKLDALGRAGVPAPYIEALRAALGSVPPLRRRLQHGDLWPANVIRHDGAWWLIDFAEFGSAQVPMYDVFLFIDHTLGMLGLDTADQQWTFPSQQVVAASADRLGLGPVEVGAAMVYYLVHLSEHRLHHGSGHQNRASFMRGVLRVAESLRDGCSLEDLPFPWEHSGPEVGARAALANS